MSLKDKKSIIIYYSRAGQNYSNGNVIDIPVGNTEVIANYIKDLTDADIFKVETVDDYPTDYLETTEVAKKELKDNYRPAIKKTLTDISEYEVIYIGCPNWWGTLPMCMFTQLEQLDFNDKTVKTFVTHEGSGLADVMRDIKKLCDGADIKRGLAIHGSSVDEAFSTVEKWIVE